MKLHHDGTYSCPKCGKTLPLNAFGSNKSAKSGKNCYCKSCVREISESRKTYYQKWCADNRAAVTEKGVERNRRNPNRKAIVLRSYQKNRDKALVWKRKYYKANKEKWKECKTSPEVRKLIKNRYRARKANVPHERYSPKAIFEKHNWLCAYCGNPAKALDHVIPLFRGGFDTAENLIAACHSCNSSKGYKLLSEWTPPKLRAITSVS
jgi:5-methylcytosine-specific restriction endonuclease McrA